MSEDSTAQAPNAGFDPELDAALKKVLAVIYKDHPLSPNQILVLASELQRLGVHQLVEEHIRKFEQPAVRLRLRRAGAAAVARGRYRLIVLEELAGGLTRIANQSLYPPIVGPVDRKVLAVGRGEEALVQ